MIGTAYQPQPFVPRRVASWWSTPDDLLWPGKRVRDAVPRRADALAAAEVDTVIQFGFHLRFDFAQHFGNLHGYLAEVAEALHARGLRFIDHYSCNNVARPNSVEEQRVMHRWQRHHVLLYPDAEARATAGYAGFRFDDLLMIDVETGRPGYCPIYQTALFCPNNPGFQAMHEHYLRRLMAEVPIDGLQADDMTRYTSFRTCGCRFCRERFRREDHHELPSLTDASFWGDTTQPPADWGDYDNPAFRDWVRLGYRSYADHLALVKRVLGADRVLLTCGGGHGPIRPCNALGYDYERFIESCDWVFMENCGLSADTVNWAPREPDAFLQKAIAATKPAAGNVACSYYIYQDGAYLGWALARFWGVVNWSSTLHHRLEEDPPDMQEEAALIGPYNRWERTHSELGIGQDVVEARIAFVGHARDNGWRDPQGRDHWARVSAWANALQTRNVGYRFVLSGELANGTRLTGETTPLILDGCGHLDDAHRRALTQYLQAGGILWVVPPLGEWDALGERRANSFLEELRAQDRGSLRVIDTPCADQIPEILDTLVPRLRRITGPDHWSARLLLHHGRPAIHLLNRALEPVLHPTIDAWQDNKVLHRIEGRTANEPLVLELHTGAIPLLSKALWLRSPESDTARPVVVESTQPGVLRLTLDLRSLRLYAVVHD